MQAISHHDLVLDCTLICRGVRIESHILDFKGKCDVNVKPNAPVVSKAWPATLRNTMRLTL